MGVESHGPSVPEGVEGRDLGLKGPRTKKIDLFARFFLLYLCLSHCPWGWSLQSTSSDTGVAVE